MLPSVEADASPQESSRAVEASRHVAPPDVATVINEMAADQYFDREMCDEVAGFAEQVVDDLIARGVLRVSDGDAKHEDPKGLSPQGASAVPEGETPHPSPLPSDKVEELIERLKLRARLFVGVTDQLCLEAASALQSKDAEIERLTRERDEAQARCFRLADQVERLEDEARTRRRWLDNAKEARGYHVNVTFDTVWAETCAKADRAETAEAEAARLKAALEEIIAIAPAFPLISQLRKAQQLARTALTEKDKEAP